MINTGMLFASSMRLNFGGPVIAHWLAGKSLSAVEWELMKPTQRPSVSLVTEIGIFLWIPSPLIRSGKSAVFGLRSPLPPLVSVGGGLVCELVGKADLLSDNFDNKQSRESVDQPLICLLSPSLITIAFRSSEVRCLLSDLYHYGGTDQFMFPLFFKWIANVLATQS